MARIAPESQERQVSHDVGDGGVQNRRSQLGRTQPGGDARRMPGRQITLDRVACHYGIVHEKAQRDDQAGDGDLLEVDAEHISHAERHQQGQRYRDSHQERRPPFPKTDERNDHHQDNRLVKTVHEQLNIFLDLLWLVAGASDDQIFRQTHLEVGEGGIDSLREAVDLLP